LSNCTPQAKFLATPLNLTIVIDKDCNQIVEPDGVNDVVADEGRDEQVVIRFRGEIVNAEPLRVDLSHVTAVNEEATVGQETDISLFRKKSERTGTEGDVHVLEVVVGARDRQVRLDGEVEGVVLPATRGMWNQLKLVDL
jgi:hypothetical protein